MITDVACPVCRAGLLGREEGRLDQSGDSFLPTVVWRCALCEYTRYEAATTARWQPSHPSDAVEPAPAAAPAMAPDAPPDAAPMTPRRAA